MDCNHDHGPDPDLNYSSAFINLINKGMSIHVMSFDNVEGPNLPTLADLKVHLRSEPLYLQVLENYLHNAANLINGLRARLERSEGEIPNSELIRGPTPPSMEHERDLERDREDEGRLVLCEDQPVPSLVNDMEEMEEEEIAEQEVLSEGFLTERTFVVSPRAPTPAPVRRDVEGVREIVL
uniref:Elf4 domain-containing protein n=1 Tax=Elaeophora elaphi TaxID=1147741 RepID=A0A0R3RKC0_9BILA